MVSSMKAGSNRIRSVPGFTSAPAFLNTAFASSPRISIPTSLRIFSEAWWIISIWSAERGSIGETVLRTEPRGSCLTAEAEAAAALFAPRPPERRRPRVEISSLSMISCPSVEGFCCHSRSAMYGFAPQVNGQISVALEKVRGSRDDASNWSL